VSCVSVTRPLVRTKNAPAPSPAWKKHSPIAIALERA
jgi:hypothetical protein